ncbi:MAG: hypothetical protein RL685_5926 [Pseudomonadota bacterium]
MSGAEGIAAASFLPGELVDGKYRVERVLGRGGMGLVLLARNLLLQERVAIKVLVGKSTPALCSRLLMEARAAARLQSDHVVRVFDVGHSSAGDPYLVMEYLAGEPLSVVLESGGQQPVTQVVQWVLEACQGLAVAHCNGIVHRDLKPANLFWSRQRDGSRRLKVLDFGVAKLPDREGLVSTLHPLGSPMYMAPEQFAREAGSDGRIDIWGLGVVLYEALTGKPPFVAHSLLDLASQLRNEAHVPVRELRPDVPEGLSRAVDRCLAKRREERWQDLVELACAITPFGPVGAGEALARIERTFATGRAPGETLGSGSDWMTSGGDAMTSSSDATSGERAAPALTPEPELPTPALSMSLSTSLVGPPRRSGRARQWLLCAAFTGMFCYVGAVRHDRLPLDEWGTRVPAPETAHAPLSRPLPAAPHPLTGTRPPSAGAPAPAVAPAPLEPSAPRRTQKDRGSPRGSGAPRRPAAAAKHAASIPTASNQSQAPRQPPASVPASDIAGPLPLDRQVTW